MIKELARYQKEIEGHPKAVKAHREEVIARQQKSMREYVQRMKAENEAELAKFDERAKQEVLDYKARVVALAAEIEEAKMRDKQDLQVIARFCIRYCKHACCRCAYIIHGTGGGGV